jgi:uncharacterized protein YdaU (DUF1376 family)
MTSPNAYKRWFQVIFTISIFYSQSKQDIMSTELHKEMTNFGKKRYIRLPVEEKSTVVKKKNVSDSTRLSKLEPEVKKLPMGIDNSARMDKKTTNFSKIKKMAGSKRIDSFEKLYNELVTIANTLTQLYRTSEMKKAVRARWEVMNCIRCANSLMEKLKGYQSQTGRMDLDGILSSFYYQMVKISSTMTYLEKEVKGKQQIEHKTTENLSQSEKAWLDSKKVVETKRKRVSEEVQQKDCLETETMLPDKKNSDNFSADCVNPIFFANAVPDIDHCFTNVSDMERLKNDISKEKQNEATEKESSDEAKKKNGGKKKRRRNVAAKTRQNPVQGSSSDSWWRRGPNPNSEKNPPSSFLPPIKSGGANTSDAENHVKIDAVTEKDSLNQKSIVDDRNKVADTNVYVPPHRRGANYKRKSRILEDFTELRQNDWFFVQMFY